LDERLLYVNDVSQLLDLIKKTIYEWLSGRRLPTNNYYYFCIKSHCGSVSKVGVN